MSKDLQLEMNQVVGMDPVLGGLSNEGTLCPSRGRITLDWMSTGPYEVVQAGEFDYDSIPIVFIKRTPFQIVADEAGL